MIKNIESLQNANNDRAKVNAGKAFKKGEEVVCISKYDDRSFYFTRAIVQSCGKVKMTLSNKETGAMMGCDFCPAEGFVSRFFSQQFTENDRPVWHAITFGTFKNMTDDEAVAACEMFAETYRVYQIGVHLRNAERHEQEYNNGNESAYSKGQRADAAKLSEQVGVYASEEYKAECRAKWMKERFGK